MLPGGNGHGSIKYNLYLFKTRRTWNVSLCKVSLGCVLGAFGDRLYTWKSVE